MRFEINETAAGIVAPDKKICKVKGCKHQRRPDRKLHKYIFCKEHSGLRRQMAKIKYKELMNNNELVAI